MQKSFIALLLIGSLCGFPAPSCVYSQPTSNHSIGVQIKPNVELLGFVYFLGYEGAQLETHDSYLKNRSIKRSEWYSYGFSVYQHYKRYQSSPHLALIMRYAERIWLDYLLNLLLQLNDFPHAQLSAQIQERYYLRFSPTNDPQEAQRNASQFIDAMNQLYGEVDFDSYLRSSTKLYNQALTQVKQGLPWKRFIPAIEAFYGRRFEQYTFVPSLTIPTGMGFGLQYMLAQQDRTFHVFGPFKPQQFTKRTTLNMGFDDPKHLLELSTHEFGHPFVNPVVDSLPAELIQRTAYLFEPIRSFMADQGYTSWKACLYEHFVRAGEIIIAQNLGHRRQAARLKAHYLTNRHFIYLPSILTELDSYNQQRIYFYPQAVKKAMHRLVEWGSHIPYKQVSHSIHQDNEWLGIQVKGIRQDGEKIAYSRDFPVQRLTASQRDSLKNHVLDSLGIKSAKVVISPSPSSNADVMFACRSCGRRGNLEVYGDNFVATRKINARRGANYRFPIHLRLGVGDYRLIYRSWLSKPLETCFRVKSGSQILVQIK
ncbi:DUF4932 domain-containing protein [Spirosoma sp.]|uniref:DUF4932 domain-containing protein n=1 Tax=Spirosoma sp. TaxID=1899569 RepID=UPI0026198F39|nr:DUF4932 domain-containing protein [Spirosoma sp.]MCX6215826.1 DUF4932 domain-containing protein [Spirosoma sp.]